MTTHEEIIDRLFELHATLDPRDRTKLLEEVVTQDVAFDGVSATFHGIEEFDVGFRSDVFGAELVRTSGVDHHGGWLRNTWEMRLDDGSPATDDEGNVYGGLQISRLTDDGRLRTIVPWLGVEPPPR